MLHNSVLAKLHPKPQNPHRPTHYQPYEQELNMHDIEMPMKLSQISKFEKQNNISINVFGFEESVVFLYISPHSDFLPT